MPWYSDTDIYIGGYKFDPSLDIGPLAPFIPDVGLHWTIEIRRRSTVVKFDDLS